MTEQVQGTIEKRMISPFYRCILQSDTLIQLELGILKNVSEFMLVRCSCVSVELFLNFRL
jgi:hypothetical protein